MTEKRKVSKGRILKSGESQRKDLTYQYRFTRGGKRHVIYAQELLELREKEAEIQMLINKGLDYSFSKITIIELFERYMDSKQNLSYKTLLSYNNILRILKEEEFGFMLARELRTTEAKKWLVKLKSEGKGYKYVELIKNVMRSVFQNAYEEDIIIKNPFNFRLDFIEKDSKKKIALTQTQQQQFLEYVKNDYYYNVYYDQFNVLLGTGLRASEFVGLTIKDVNFKKECISVNHQLLHKKGAEYYIGRPKTEKGKRDIPMTATVCNSMKNIIKNSGRVGSDIIVDGYSGFIMFDKKGNLQRAENINRILRKIVDEYNISHEDKLPKITAHVFRHTFCSNMVIRGMNVKTLQYMMGHSSSEVTLNVYSHITFEDAREELKKVIEVDFRKSTAV